MSHPISTQRHGDTEIMGNKTLCLRVYVLKINWHEVCYIEGYRRIEP